MALTNSLAARVMDLASALEKKTSAGNSMKNIYHDHLELLRDIKIQSSPVISFYVPLKWNDSEPSKTYSGLVKTANGFLKGGHFKLKIITPEWEKWAKQGTVTLAIFHHDGVTNLVPIPTRMQPRVVVSNSFHVKPIITAANEYIDGLLLHFNKSGASSYRINPIGEFLLDSYLPSKMLPKNDWPVKIERASLREFLEFLILEISRSTDNSTKILGITGAEFSELRSESFWKRTKLPVCFLDDSFKSAIPENAFSSMRLRLSHIINERHSQSVLDALKTNPASQEGLVLKDLGIKILNKEINHLCVSLDDMHYGELDVKTGQTKVNEFQSNLTYDDLLDDLVELAIDNGIKVSVVPKKYLPIGKSFVASKMEKE
jgi:hypothetical protein